MASGAVIFSGGIERLSAGGTATATRISAGGVEAVSAGATDSAALVSAGGTQVVLAGGVAWSASVLSGGTLRVSAGGVALNATISGVEIVTNGGGDQGAYVWSGGVLAVSSGGAARDDTIVYGGSGRVLSGGTIQDVAVMYGGALTVSSGGIIDGPISILGGTVGLNGPVASGTTVSFAGSGGELVLANPTTFAGTIAGLSLPSQEIDLKGFAYSSTGETVSWTEAANNASGTLSVSSGGQVAALNLVGSYVTSNFTLSTDHDGGTIVVDPPVSSGAGTAYFAQAMAGFNASAAIAGDAGFVSSGGGPFTSPVTIPGAASAAAHG